ncbi:MAG: hypothetical protein KAU07_01430 [Candidatus Andersenbacteria bacterium]|nr:hypothetical protein [Candidatus Andersenbacteria bacterium]
MKKESLLASMPKLILVVSSIVCIGTVIGLMGWLIANQYKADHDSIKQKISMQISTDKEEYDIGENIKIKVSLTNISSNYIGYSEPNCFVTGNKNWLPVNINVITKYGNINLYQKGIKNLSAVCSPVGIGSIKSGEAKEGHYEWDQKVYTNSFNVQAPSGNHKIAVTFCEFANYPKESKCHTISTTIKIKGDAKEFLTKNEAIRIALLDEEAEEWYENYKGANFKDFYRYEEIKNIKPRTIGGALIEENSKYAWYVFFSALEIKKELSYFNFNGLQKEQIESFKKQPDEISVKVDAYSGKVLEIRECGHECRKKYHHW